MAPQPLQEACFVSEIRVSRGRTGRISGPCAESVVSSNPIVDEELERNPHENDKVQRQLQSKGLRFAR